MTVGQRDLGAFLGKKNFKGLYTKNPLSRTPAYAQFDRSKMYLKSYPIRAVHRNKKLVDWPKVFNKDNVERTRQPFAQNALTKSNRLIGETLRQAIVNDHNAGESIQKLSFKYGIVVPRIEAVIRLAEVRSKFVPQGNVAKDVAKYSKVMKELFDHIPTDAEGRPLQKVDNLTEIPIPKEVSQQFFKSIAESEPFGPVDAANVLGIDPASTILSKLTNVEEVDEHAHTTASTKKDSDKVSFYAEQLEGDRHRWRFTDAKVGKVGYHYGASKDDRKHARRVRFLPDGQQAWPEPEHSK